MHNPLNVPRAVKCRVCVEDVERIDSLVDHVNRRATWFQIAKRSEVVRALTRQGLDLAQIHGITVDYLESDPAQKLAFKLSSEEFDRVTSLQSAYVEGSSRIAKPPLASLQRALIRLGLAEVERDDGVSSFVNEVQASLWPRRASPRRGRRAAEARPKDQRATAAHDPGCEAARHVPTFPVVPTVSH